MVSFKQASAVVICGMILIYGQPAWSVEPANYLASLVSTNMGAIQSSERALVSIQAELNPGQRRDLIIGLANIITNDVAKGPTRFISIASAISVLGEMRVTESIDVLLSRIAFDPALGYMSLSKLGRPVTSIYPATVALIKIGEPCIPKVIEKLASSQGVAEYNACLAVLVGIRGHEGAVGLLTEDLSTETVEKRRTRLQAGMETISKDRGGFPEPAESPQSVLKSKE